MSRTKDPRAGGAAAGWNVFPETGAQTIVAANANRVMLASGQTKTDYVMGWGSLMLGHNPARVSEKVAQAVSSSGFAYQYESPDGIRLAETLRRHYPAAEAVRFTNSGLEATMYAIRVARAYTGRSKVVKFEGHFHGLNDALLYNIDASERPGRRKVDGTLAPMPGTGGLPENPRDLIVVPFNDFEAINSVVQAYRTDLAAIVLEPIAMNIGCVAPDPGFIESLREQCDKNDILLIFDEVLTGFRVGLGGAAERFGVQPDLACFGKAFGCGAPLGALAGSSAVMEAVEPPGVVPISGTNTGRRLTMIWANAAMEELEQPGTYERLFELNELLSEGFRRTFRDAGVPAYIEGYGGRVGVHIGHDKRPRNMAQICEKWNRDLHYALYKDLAANGSLFGFLLPLRLCPEPVTVTLVHSKDDIEEAMSQLRAALARVS